MPRWLSPHMRRATGLHRQSPVQEGLRKRNSPMRTLNQNGYGDGMRIQMTMGTENGNPNSSPPPKHPHAFINLKGYVWGGILTPTKPPDTGRFVLDERRELLHRVTLSEWGLMPHAVRGEDPKAPPLFCKVGRTTWLEILRPHQNPEKNPSNQSSHKDVGSKSANKQVDHSYPRCSALGYHRLLCNYTGYPVIIADICYDNKNHCIIDRS